MTPTHLPPVRPWRATTLILFLGLLTLLSASAVRAQQPGTIAGVVVDRETGETLIGVQVAAG